jgi:hypothetical protein
LGNLWERRFARWRYFPSSSYRLNLSCFGVIGVARRPDCTKFYIANGIYQEASSMQPPSIACRRVKNGRSEALSDIIEPRRTRVSVATRLDLRSSG